MYFSLLYSTPPPWLLTRARVCERMGWTFAEFDALEVTDVYDLLYVWDGEARAREALR